jgi:two-component system sensor histidine kinase RstB
VRGAFVRAFFGLLLAYVVSTILLVFALNGGLAYSPERGLARIYGGPAALIVERLRAATPADREVVLADLRRSFAYPLAAIARDAVPSSVGERLSAGETFVLRWEPIEGSRIYVPLDAASVLVLGPLPGSETVSGPRPLLAIGAVVTVFAIALLLVLRPIARELRLLEDLARAAEGGDYGVRAPARIRIAAPFARAFNAMLARTAALLEAQRELFRAVSHEIRTPLARLEFRIDGLARARDLEARAAAAEAAAADLEAIDALVSELLTYARLEPGAPLLSFERVELATVVEGAVAEVLPRDGITITARLESVLVDGDRRLLARAIGNLLANAVRHARSAVEVTIHRSGDRVVVDVDDDGPGIPASDRTAVFAPFQRGEGGGVGLGLAIVRRITDAHGASIAITDGGLGGCRVRIVFAAISGAG